jgi:hypothetical protein
MRGIAFTIAVLLATGAAAQQSKTERCMAIDDFKLAMACLQGLVVEQNREKMRRAVRSY